MTSGIEQEVLATVRASAPRRFVGMLSLSLLGVMLIYVGLFLSPELIWKLFLILLGAVSLWSADAMRRATANGIELTETELREADGTLISPIADIVGIDRGFFAFKPSNGFMIKTKTAQPRQWRPGLWWRIGNRIGVGGMTSAGQTKNMAEILGVIIAKRDLQE